VIWRFLVCFGGAWAGALGVGYLNTVSPVASQGQHLFILHSQLQIENYLL
jgi:hypothetical protein